jgi:hypothetical protein
LSGCRLALLGALLAAAACAPAQAPQTVRTLDELEAALRAAGPGDCVLLADGLYRTRRPVEIQGLRGSAQAPVTLRAEHRGRAEIGGAAGFALKACEHVVIEGLVFTHDADAQAVRLDGCRGVRVTRNVFRLSERQKPRHMEHWVYAVGANSASNRIDHNRFERKANSGSHVFVRGDDASLVCSQYDRIDHNHFLDVVHADGANGYETLRTGSNDLGASGRSSFTVIERNLLERCSGESEIISVKSSDTLVRQNTLVDCFGMICLRLGNRSEVSGNFILATDGRPGRGGVKFYGCDHRVLNNYFQGLTGTRHESPLALVPGIYDTPTTDRIGKRYDSLTTVPPTRGLVAFNTWVDCSALQFGFKRHEVRTFVPRANVFVNNLVVRTRPQAAALVNLERIDGLDARGNIGYDAGKTLDPAWAGWFRVEEPPLTREEGGFGLWRLTAAIPAADVPGSDLARPDEDVFGRPRDGRCGAGAEAFGPGADRRRPLTPADVGPEAP